MKTNQAVRTSFVLAFAALALGGCGGGSSSSGGFGFDLDDFGDGDVSIARTVAQNAARAEPTPGSVTQSSNVDGAGVTLDQIAPSVTFVNDIPGSRNLRIDVRNTRVGSWGTVSTTDRILDGESVEDDDFTFHHRTIGKRLEGGGAVVADVYTDRTGPADTDYMVGGVWVRLLGDAGSVDDLEIGAFVDRTEALTGAAYLQTTAEATYDGSAVGVGMSDEEDGPLISQFTADVDLIASFGTTPKIKGEVRGFDKIEGDDDDGIDGLVLMLEETDIGNTDGGFFKGVTSLSIPDPDDPTGSPFELTGKWGGQFYGDTAQHAAGTFGVSVTDPNFNAAYVGAFVAEKE